MRKKKERSLAGCRHAILPLNNLTDINPREGYSEAVTE